MINEKSATKEEIQKITDIAETLHESLPNKVKEEAANEGKKLDETPLTVQVDAPPVVDRNPSLPPGYPEASKRPAITPSLYKAPMGKAKHERRIMDFETFLHRINYRTHDGIIQAGHGQNLSDKG